jgi:hypothetical protein
MKIRQLMEGQKEQLAQLRPNGPIALYYPTDIDDAVNVLRTSDMNASDKHTLEVMPSLKDAVRYSDVVLMFYAQGRDLYPSRAVIKNHRDREIAARKYPESFRPEVSFSMLSQRPTANYHGHLSPGNVDKIFFVRDGRPEAVNMEQFVEIVIKHQTEQKRRRQQRVDVHHA